MEGGDDVFPALQSIVQLDRFFCIFDQDLDTFGRYVSSDLLRHGQYAVIPRTDDEDVRPCLQELCYVFRMQAVPFPPPPRVIDPIMIEDDVGCVCLPVDHDPAERVGFDFQWSPLWQEPEAPLNNAVPDSRLAILSEMVRQRVYVLR